MPTLGIAYAIAIGCSGDSTSQLMAQLKDADPQARRAAAEALAVHPGDLTTVVPALETSLEDTDPAVRLAAAFSLAKLAPDHVAYRAVILQSLCDGHGPVFVQVGQWGDRARWATPTLVELLTDRRPQIRALAAKTLGQIGAADGDTATALQQSLRDENRAVRKAAEQALRQLLPTAATDGP